MRIGELARRAGTTTRTLRFYESQGLLTAQRSANGYRDYDEGDLPLVTEIRTLQTVGLTLDDTRPFVDCLRAGHESGDACVGSIEVYRRKLAEVDACINRLAAVHAELHDKLTRALTGFTADPCTVPEEPT
ncbi:MAG: MerR family DNA-binding transcriptional regulator [Actinophytocola sp.]|uniref:MerR family transcriptional regulator n=1 Tax=Actinophytocola sp. TaxID=1872138 RepID=UPI00132BB3F3|nr:MerR family transcriptional regulator [Actinophytocola sp.]MPZ80650.1 MerR family DNA-binding transcriptional regulator [Actinophytocola sp.]